MHATNCMFIFLQNSYAEILTIDVTALAGGAVGRWLGREDGCARIPALTRRDRRACFLSHLPTMWTYSRGQLSAKQALGSLQTLGLQAPCRKYVYVVQAMQSMVFLLERPEMTNAVHLLLGGDPRCCTEQGMEILQWRLLAQGASNWLITSGELHLRSRPCPVCAGTVVLAEALHAGKADLYLRCLHQGPSTYTVRGSLPWGSPSIPEKVLVLPPFESGCLISRSRTASWQRHLW